VDQVRRTGTNYPFDDIQNRVEFVGIDLVCAHIRGTCQPKHVIAVTKLKVPQDYGSACFAARARSLRKRKGTGDDG
jgi:hypothetical protein